MENSDNCPINLIDEPHEKIIDIIQNATIIEPKDLLVDCSIPGQILYASELSQDLMKELTTILKGKLKKYKEVAQLFIIQYTYFEKEEDGWVMKTFLDIANERLENIYLSISQNNTTHISVYGKNPKFGVLKIKHLLDMRLKSKPDLIYACDLYYDFTPEHFWGKCYTK